MLSPYQFWIDLGRLLVSPKDLFIGWFELTFSWLYTRNWRALLFGLPVLAVSLIMLGSAVYVRWLGSDALLQRYWDVIEQQGQKSTLLISERSESESADAKEEAADTNDASSTTLMSEEELSPFAASLLMKVLQLEASDTRANYLVASALGQQGRLSQARQMMRRIAPEGEKGFAPAHAWLAADRVQSLGVKDKRELVVLLNDLSIARAWPGVAPMLLGVYGDLLLREGDAGESMAVLREAGRRDSRFLVKLAEVAKRNSQPQTFAALRDEIITSRQQKIEQGLATELDYVEITSMQLLDEQYESAASTASQGLKAFATSVQLKRLLSNSYMLAFEEATKKKAAEEIRMEILDLAMKSDPGNPAVIEKLAAMTAEGTLTDEKMSAFLREQLANGKATAVTHLLLAIGHLKQQELDKALTHLEIAQGLSPNNPVILNNLALCTARLKPDELPKARRMMEVALTVSGADAELLDTYGEILSQGGDYTAAIRAFEAALALDQTRQGTRKKLADAYTKVALDEMAETVSQQGLIPKSDLLPPINADTSK